MIRPACRGVAMSDKLALSDMIREARSDAMGKARKFDPQGPSTPPEGAEKEAWEIAEASENAARSARSDAAAPRPLARLGAGLRSAAIQAAGPSDPKRRSFADPGNRAEASAERRVGVRLGGGPLPCPARVPRAPPRRRPRESWATSPQRAAAGLGAGGAPRQGLE